MDISHHAILYTSYCYTRPVLHTRNDGIGAYENASVPDTTLDDANCLELFVFSAIYKSKKKLFAKIMHIVYSHRRITVFDVTFETLLGPPRSCQWARSRD